MPSDKNFASCDHADGIDDAATHDAGNSHGTIAFWSAIV
jgi:hypothetical protein